ncbi:CRISPR-associated endonuclease Cas1 [Mangrovibacterium sp.]|uniref:CRISPR-associated endonuclease Cas1 n=1 Tax=Mangrovibacterium sp. TaxID=1961364 RepID=UPI003563AA61
MDLILNSYGTALSRDNECFVVIHTDGKQRIHPQGLKSICISKGAQITSDAALLAIEHEIEVLFVDQSGNPQGRLWSHRYGSVSTIRKGQLEFSFSKEAVQWICKLIASKIENQQALLLSLASSGSDEKNPVNKSINKLEDYRGKILQLEGEVIPDIASTLRGWEGAASRVYFECVNIYLPTPYRLTGRKQHPATDLSNCLLNYAYGVLYGKIEGALIKAGIDPYVGIFHRDDYNRPVLVFDVIELYRVWADYVVFNLAMQEAINEDCYSIRDDGSYWLESLGKRILIQSLNDYLDEVINIGGLQRSRANQLLAYARDLAQKFKNFA